MVKTNHLFLRPPMNNITNVIIIYIITAPVSGSINVSGDFVLKSDSSRTIDDFTGITANSVAVPYVSAEEMIFLENFGLTISGELLMSTTPR